MGKNEPTPAPGLIPAASPDELELGQTESVEREDAERSSVPLNPAAAQRDFIGLESKPDDRPARPEETDRDSEVDMQQLTELLVGPERESIAAWEKKLEDSRLSQDELSQMLPLAIRKAANRDGSLASALGPTMANSFQDSVQRNPKALADAISPIMGPAIRRSISQAIAGMIQSLNQTIEHSFSWNGLTWRWQAFKTNKPFAEVVLLNVFVYRVEQVFLIHRNDGSLLAHASAAGGGGADADLVSGMLTAIQDFVRQSFGASDEEAVESMRVGQHHVWIVPSSHAMLAAVIRGVPPHNLRDKLKRELELIQAELSQDLADYNGDNAPFEFAMPRLEACLRSQAREYTSARPSPLKKLIPIAILLVPLLLAGWLAYWGGTKWIESQRYARAIAELNLPPTATVTLQDGAAIVSGQASHEWLERTADMSAALAGLKEIDVSQVVDLDQAWLRYLAILREEPGILVTDAEIVGDRYSISGLRDSDAKDPVALLRQSGVDADRVHARWEPYESLEPRFVKRRVLRRAPQAGSVAWSRVGDRLVATGEAHRPWFAQVDAYEKSLGNSIELDISQVVDLDDRALEESLSFFEDVFVAFKPESSQIDETELQRIDEIARRVLHLQLLSQRLSARVDIFVVGYDDKDSARNSLSKQRANRVWQAMWNAGAKREGLFVRDGGYVDHGVSTGQRGCQIKAQLRP